MAKIWLNAGHGGNDPGACANGRSEAVQVEKLARAVGKLLSDAGHTVWYTRDISPYMATYVPYENGKPADIFVSFHQNAGGGRGYESFVTGTNNCALACAKVLAGDMAKIWSLRGSTYGAGVKNHTETAVGSLYVVSGTVSPAFLGEFGFIDNAADMKIFDDNFDYIARCCANRISQAVGGKAISTSGITATTAANNNTASNNAPKTNKIFDAFYRVRTQKHGWLPEVKNLADYAGYEDSPITDIAIKVSGGSIAYRVHLLGGGWLPKVTGYNINDAVNGYAGNGQVIDAIEVYFYTPAGCIAKKAKYRVAPCGGGYYPWQYDNETGNGQDGYAGAMGVKMGKFQLCIE